MTTPFDQALGVQRRTMDRVRLAIAEVTRRAYTLQEQEIELARSATVERRQVGATLIPFDAYFGRLRSQSAAIARARTLATQDLDRLRDEARAELGSLKALEQAAERFRAERERELSAADQMAADDLAGFEIVRLSRLRRSRSRA